MNTHKQIFLAMSLAIALSLVGCDDATPDPIPTPLDLTKSFALPEDMKDCKVYYVDSDTWAGVKVVKCPLSSTTTSYSYPVGKSTMYEHNTVIDPNPPAPVAETFIVVDGVKYKKVDEEETK